MILAATEVSLEVLDGGFIQNLVTITFLAVFWLSAPVNILTDPHRHGLRVGSVDLLWAIASVAFFPLAPLAWFAWGRSVRRAELRRTAERDQERALL